MTNLSAVQKWIKPETNKPIFLRKTAENLEPRTVAAAELFKEGFYRTITSAAKELDVPYYRLRSRIQGHHSVAKNGGNQGKFNSAEEQEILCWAHRRVTQGHHVQTRSLQQHAKAILKANGKEPKVSRFWAKRFLKRNPAFHIKKSVSRDARRKAMQDRGTVERFFYDWNQFLRYNRIKKENVWNIDETGFMIGFLQNRMPLYTFTDLDTAVLTDSGNRTSITTVEAISAAGASIPSFVIVPGINIPQNWLVESLDPGVTIVTNDKGYINDQIFIEYFHHFNNATKPQDPSEKRVVLLNNCENHFLEEVVHFCVQNNIELFPLPPHLTHYLQPLDVGVFNVYKHWHQQILYRELQTAPQTSGSLTSLPIYKRSTTVPSRRI